MKKLIIILLACISLYSCKQPEGVIPTITQRTTITPINLDGTNWYKAKSYIQFKKGTNEATQFTDAYKEYRYYTYKMNEDNTLSLYQYYVKDLSGTYTRYDTFTYNVTLKSDSLYFNDIFKGKKQ